MSYQEARELASLRQELREQLSLQRRERAREVLSKFRAAAVGEPSLQHEYERWSLRFSLLRDAA